MIDLESYFEFISLEIASRYRSLTLEQVYATLLYYFRNREKVEGYLNEWRAYTDKAWQEYQKNHRLPSGDFAG